MLKGKKLWYNTSERFNNEGGYYMKPLRIIKLRHFETRFRQSEFCVPLNSAFLWNFSAENLKEKIKQLRYYNN